MVEFFEKFRLKIGLFAAVMGVAATCSVIPGSLRAQDARELLFAALENPGDSVAFNAYLGSLPQTEGGYIIDGDQVMTAREIRLLLRAVAAERAQHEETGTVEHSMAQPELIVDKEGVWPEGQRQLTYAVDRTSFGEARYARAVEAMARAADAWVAACDPCNLTITHVPEQDHAPNPNTVTFIVSLKDMKAIGKAFYPADSPAKRALYLSPKIFEAQTPYDFDGVFRHEIGHILGYRHEHIRSPIFGCMILSDKDDRASWAAIPGFETVDHVSVMHYPCKGSGTKTFELTELDIAAHRVMYGSGSTGGVVVRDLTESTGQNLISIRLSDQEASAPAQHSVTAEPTVTLAQATDEQPHERRKQMVDLVIEFLGADQNAEIAEMISRLYIDSDEAILPPRPVTVEAGDTSCSIMARELDIRCGAPETFALMATYNDGQNLNVLQQGQDFNVPSARVDSFRYELQLKRDPTGSIANQKKWIEKGATIISERQVSPDGDRRVVETIGRRLTVTVPVTEINTVLNTYYNVRPANSSVTINHSVNPKERFSATQVHAREKVEECKMNRATDGKEAAYWMMLDNTPKSWPTCARSCTGPQCPQIVLPDGLSYTPSDLASSLRLFDEANNEIDIFAAAEEICSNPPPATASACEIQRFDKDCHHALSMASVMAASDDGKGFVGLAPDAPVALFDWQSASEFMLSQFIDARSRIAYTAQHGPQIFVFASKLSFGDEDIAAIFEATSPGDLRKRLRAIRAFEAPSYSKSLVNGRVLDQQDDRFDNRVVKMIADRNLLWITSAGQLPDTALDAPVDPDTPKPFILSKFSSIAPMNLGDLDNVIVVTACESCEWGNITLWDAANYGRTDGPAAPNTANAVTIAAPLDGYHAPLDSKRILEAHGGTSQAAAFVGGVVAGMTRCAPNFYVTQGNIIQSDQIKRRLILTSLPRLRSSKREAAGVVNPAAALLPPTQTSAKLRSQATQEPFATLKDAKHLTCGVDWLRISEAEQDRGQMSADNIRRVLRVPKEMVPEWSGDQDRWFLYAQDPNSDVSIDIVGPILIRSADLDRPFIEANGRSYRLSEIDELLLPASGLPVPTTCSMQAGQ